MTVDFRGRISNAKYGKRINTKRTKNTKKHLKTRILRALRVIRGEKVG
jgi:hypothetical protein